LARIGRAEVTVFAQRRAALVDDGVAVVVQAVAELRRAGEDSVVVGSTICSVGRAIAVGIGGDVALIGAVVAVLVERAERSAENVCDRELRVSDRHHTVAVAVNLLERAARAGRRRADATTELPQHRDD
jgi:hypothetical protein